jgi:hypothetical protein
VLDLRSRLLSKNATATVNKTLGLVKVIFREVLYREEIPRDPTAGVGRIKYRRAAVLFNSKYPGVGNMITPDIMRIGNNRDHFHLMTALWTLSMREKKPQRRPASIKGFMLATFRRVTMPTPVSMCRRGVGTFCRTRKPARCCPRISYWWSSSSARTSTLR